MYLRDNNYEIYKKYSEFFEIREGEKSISTPADVYAALAEYADKEQEYFLLLSLNVLMKKIEVHEITKGIVDRSIVHPREVFRKVIMDNASKVIIAHNHPSGSLKPSIEDIKSAKAIKEAGELLGIQVLDNVIISKSGFYSFTENNKW